MTKTIKIDLETVPQYQIDTMCRVLTNCLQRAFADPEVREDYERWKKEQQIGKAPASPGVRRSGLDGETA